ncbi:MAG: carboxypeptidase M32 [Atopobiaceae bacterium]|jgi:carboxypeptidase Taq
MSNHDQTSAAQDAVYPNDLAQDIEKINTLERHLYAHRYAKRTLECHAATIDPPKATADRGEALAIFEEEDHELMMDPDLKVALDHLSAHAQELDEITRAQVKVLSRTRDDMVRVTAEDQSALTRLTCEANVVWTRAKQNNDWESFEPYVDKLVSLMKRIAHEKNPALDAYDVWLDTFERGTSCAFYDKFFAEVRDSVVPLLMDIRALGKQVRRDVIDGRFDVARQWDLARDLAKLVGVDMDGWWLSSTEHPFSEAMTSNYTMCAAHVYEHDVTSNMFTMLHECGHNSYEEGVNPRLNYTSLSGGTSAGIHEGQSRFFENYIGRDRAFTPSLLSLMQKHFPGQMGRVTPQQFWLAINRVEPQPIRIHADELTYPLHIMIRYEIEQLLFSGEATAHDVPALWRERYKRYLGVMVPSDTEGALQDSHWSTGYFGYFPTYALGGAYGAQLKAQMISDGIAWTDDLSKGDLTNIREWLRTHIWQYGRSKDPKELIVDACGTDFDPSFYTRYLGEKYRALYGI